MTDLVATAAQALVGSMTTSAWNDARAKLSAVLSTHKARKRLQAELDATRARLNADPSLQASETERWKAVLSATATADDLVAIVSELAQFTVPAPSARTQQFGVALTGSQYNVAGNLIQRG